MNKRIIAVGLLLAFLMALVYAAPMIMQREDIIIDVDIEGSGRISYNDTKIPDGDFHRRTITSDGEYRLNHPIIVDSTYIGCVTWGETINFIGETEVICLENAVMDYTDAEITAMKNEKSRVWLEEVARVQQERANRAAEIIIQEGDIKRTR